MADETNEDDSWLYGSSNNAELEESKDESLGGDSNQKVYEGDSNIDTENQEDANVCISIWNVYFSYQRQYFRISI